MRANRAGSDDILLSCIFSAQ